MLIVNDDDTCKVCGAYFQDNNYCANGHIRLEADIVRKHFKKMDSYKGPLGGNYSKWTNKQIVVGIHDDDDEIISVFDLTKHSFVYLDQKTKNGLNVVKKEIKKFSKKLK